ncbi:hypothetical protein HY857_00220 [Candidatus Saccharibacteria bacterium]|nr:hypothetical protein [Candidatus Saccharibacteria bacterium]
MPELNFGKSLCLQNLIYESKVSANMKSFEPSQPSAQHLRDQLYEVARNRIRQSEPVEVLSPGRETLLQLVEEPDGKQFVTRSFSPEAISYIEDSGMSFEDTWQTMQTILAQAGIASVRSAITIHEEDGAKSDYPIVIVSEYLADNRPVMEASTESKIELARNLPGLFNGSGGLMLSSETIRADMFKVTPDESGEEKIVMIDMDPLLVRRSSPDSLIAFYIEKFGAQFWDDWCLPEEREAVITQFIIASGLVLDNKLDDINNPVSKVFLNAHMMSQGLDYREFGTI